MNTCPTCGTPSQTFDLGIQLDEPGLTRPHDEKLEFVEHVLGVMIESRFGYEHPYVRIGEPIKTSGHSQMFANIRLLTAADIERHLKFGGAHYRQFLTAFFWELPLASANGPWFQKISGFSPTALWAKARETLELMTRRLKPTAIQGSQTDGSPMPRGSPTFLGRTFSLSPTATHIKAWVK